ncbi:MAG: hypothetical protein LBC61_04630 [Candidatus Peribacteria bacterium]|nr:hypothetical protein [Candidatus Peribacteria bacterium]
MELGSLVNLNNSASPYINRKYFTSASTDPYYRTSITLLTDHSKAWYVGFNN